MPFKVISLRVSAELKEKLKNIPNRNQYIERLLYERMNELIIAGADWDYEQQWSLLNDVIIQAGIGIKKLTQNETQNAEADKMLQDTLKRIMKLLIDERNPAFKLEKKELL